MSDRDAGPDAGTGTDPGAGAHAVPEAAPDPARKIAAGYAFSGPALDLGALLLSARGVAVFLADVKGDLSGIARSGRESDRVRQRSGEVGQSWTPAGFPAEFYALGGIGHGIPVRATVTSFGPVLLSKVLGSTRPRSSPSA